MILVDTSVWVDHLRVGNAKLADALRAGQVATHPFVIGELACGNLKSREAVLSLMHGLPVVPVADDDETLFFIEQNALMGRGIGYIDAHLLAATAIATPTRLWTHDKRLGVIAAALKLAYRAAAT
jgi:predicted nucleic acid-binding protein